MFDYKLIIILILCVVVYLIYNKTDSLKCEIDKLKLKTMDKSKENYLSSFYNVEEEEKINLENNLIEEDNNIIENNNKMIDQNSVSSIDIDYNDNITTTYSNEKEKEIKVEEEDINNEYQLENNYEVTSEKNTIKKINLEDLKKYKLKELQDYAKEYNIEIQKLCMNGKHKNKTKKELVNEICSCQN